MALLAYSGYWTARPSLGGAEFVHILSIRWHSPCSYNPMNTLEIKALANSFTQACRIVADATKDGTVSRERASAGKETVKVSSTIAAAHGLDGEELKKLKTAIKQFNAGHQFQDAFGVKLAWLATYADGQSQVENILATEASKGNGSRRAGAPAEAVKA